MKPTLQVVKRAVIACVLGAPVACAAPLQTRPGDRDADVILRGGTIVDGSGAPRYRADIAIADGRIAAIGDLKQARAQLVLDVSGLMVAPGFINLHSHASPGALPTAVNMLTQGVTTELLNPDGGGPIDIAQQLSSLQTAGLAVNVGAYAPFNSIWALVMGPADRRATAPEIDSMRALVAANLQRGAWGVSAGLDYKPAYFAKVEEVIQVLEPAAKWRTNFTNHDRLTPETGFSSRVGMLETMHIGEAAGLVPVITHMKLQGREQGSAAAFTQVMNQATARGVYTAADVYPYLAGQTSLAALIIPGWAQDGGRTAMLERFKDPALRERIAREAEEAMNARFNGAEGILLPGMRKQFVDVMREMQVTAPGEAVIRILEQGNQTSILRFGSESDLISLLQHPTASIACDCGAALMVSHPRGFGTFPRVLGHYVREQKVLTWEDAIRKMTALPAATIGMVDRGILAPGMWADITVFDTVTVIDHATYDAPNALSDGVRHVLVNGQFALRDGQPTGMKTGRVLRRATYMPSRPLHTASNRAVAAQGTITVGQGLPVAVSFDVSQNAYASRAAGSFRIIDPHTGVRITSTTIGSVQTAQGWASFTGRARLSSAGDERAFTAVIERADPFVAGQPMTLTVDIDGFEQIRGTLATTSLRIQ